MADLLSRAQNLSIIFFYTVHVALTLSYKAKATLYAKVGHGCPRNSSHTQLMNEWF